MYASVIIDITNKNVDRIFSYRVPESMLSKAQIGMRAKVPFGKGNSLRTGYIIGFSEDVDFDEDKVKDIVSFPDNYPVMSETMLSLVLWMSKKYYTTVSSCIQCVLPKLMNDKTDKYVSINYDKEGIEDEIREILKKNSLRAKVIELLKNGSMSKSDIKVLLGISSSPIDTLEKKGIIRYTEKEVRRSIYNSDDFESTIPPELNDEQKKAFEDIEAVINGGGGTVLLHGVTGSGKTEVYLRVIKEVTDRGKQAVVLVPEISLTPQTVDRFMGRFGSKVTVTHSRLSDGERYDQWRRAMNGEISVMVGARSAVFTPFNDLGCIIIDEEHEHTYKSETTPKYDAKEIADKLRELTGCTVILGSATPSVATYLKAKRGEYTLCEINKRVNQNPPNVEIIDMRTELAEGNRSVFSRKLIGEIRKNLENRKQTILFLNRRGYSTFVSCRSCGFVMKCDNCSVNFTYHHDLKKLVCHYCGKTVDNPEVCPQCGGVCIKYFGAGTQKIEEKIHSLFPEAKVLRMDLDTTKKKNSHEMILREFTEGKADILIGTQMIAKGLDFPNVTLVGVIAADMSINSGDFKCAENSFQLLTQVSGRAGRADYGGRVYIQTYEPDNYSIVYAKNGDYKSFYEYEIKMRKQMNYPPFSHIFVILFTGTDERDIIIKIHKLAEVLKFYNKKANGAPFELLGPVQAIVGKINNLYRYKITVKGDEEERLKNYVLFCVEKFRKKEYIEGININLSLDPSFIQ